jgi:hypothetical protein
MLMPGFTGSALSTGRFSEPLPTERIPRFCDDHASIGRAQRRGLVRAAGGSLGRCSARKAPLLPQCGHDQYHARSRSLPQKSRSVEAAAEWPRSTTEKSGSSQARHTRTQLSAERPRRRPVGESGGRARSFDMLILEFVMPDRLNAQSSLGRLGRRHPARPAGRSPAGPSQRSGHRNGGRPLRYGDRAARAKGPVGYPTEPPLCARSWGARARSQCEALGCWLQGNAEDGGRQPARSDPGTPNRKRRRVPNSMPEGAGSGRIRA